MAAKQKGNEGIKPELYKALRVWLEDGCRTHGMWTGERWWSVKGEVFPVKWELEERLKKIKKFFETLPSESAS